jgi:catechol 2,3-dioxygenase-like lactoylglutathione lyase family enzyme
MTLAVKGLQHLNLRVADLERARDFYVRVLGFRVAFAKGDTVWLEAGGDLLGLSRGEAERGARSDAQHFGFMVDARDEVDAWCAQLRTHGVACEKGPYDRSDGRSLYFRDPDAHLLEIFFVDPAFLPAPSRR